MSQQKHLLASCFLYRIQEVFYKTNAVLFAGNGSPMIALDNSEITGRLRQLGELIKADFGKPKGILLISAHWPTRGIWLTASAKPEMIYDMYGLSPVLYEVVYPALGDHALAEINSQADRTRSSSAGRMGS